MSARILCVLLAIGSPLSARQDARSFRDFDAYVTRAVRDWRVPGLAIAVVKDGRVEFAKGYGVRTLGSQDLVDENTLFANASTTKAFVATAAAMLVDAGSLSWDDPAIKHVPTFHIGGTDAGERLTVRHLFSHRTGFGDPSYMWYGVPTTLDTMIGRLRHLDPASGWNAGYAYNNVTYALGGRVIENILDDTWENIVRDRILTPLGMTRTATNTDEAARDANIATPHHIIRDTVTVIERYRTDNIGAAGAMYSSVMEMTNWIRFVLDSGRVGERRLMSADTFKSLLDPQVLIEPDDFYPTAIRTRPNFIAYGLGWFLQDYRGTKIVFHTGSIDGMVAIVGLVPSQKLGVVVFANLDHAEVRHALMLRVFDMYLGPPLRDWNVELRTLYDSLAAVSSEADRKFVASRKDGAAASHQLASYVGDYQHPLFGLVRVTKNDGELQLSRSHFLVANLRHWHYDVFRAEWRRPWVSTQTVSFDLDTTGEVAALEVGGFRLAKKRN